MAKTLLNFDEVMKRLVNTLKDADGYYIAEIHNKICDPEIKYKGDSLWELPEENEKAEEKE